MSVDQGRGGDLGASSSSSGHLLSEVGSQTVDVHRRPPSPDPFMAPASATVDVNNQLSSSLENGADVAGGRYSMRTRQPRQLKPYAFDRLEYKHQLKHHPDAIIKLTGYRSPVESSSPPPLSSGEEDTDGAAENLGGESLSADAQILPRAKRKKRHHTNTEHPTAQPSTSHRRPSKVQVSRRYPSLMRTVAGSSANTDVRFTPIRDLGSDNSPDMAAMWYPDAFNDMSSGLGSDDVPLNTYEDDLQVNDSPPPRIKRRRVIISLIADVCRLTSTRSGLCPNYLAFRPWCLRPRCQTHPLRVPSRRL